MSKMSDEDDDDWFNKDVDDFVVEMKDPMSAGTALLEGDVDDGETGATSALLENLALVNKQFYDDVDGNYFDPLENKSSGGETGKFALPPDSDKYVQKIPYSKLMNIVENDSHELFIDIYCQKEQFVKTLKHETMGDELLLVLMKTLNKLGTLPMCEINKELFEIVTRHKPFWDQLVKFFQRSTKQVALKKKKNRNKSVGVSTTDMLTGVIRLVGNVKRFVGVKKKVVEFVEELLTVLEKGSVKADELKQVVSNSGPPAKVTSIYPSLEELLLAEPVELKPIIVNGRYPSVDHYLDVHMTLLKEDFMIPLREGIQSFMRFAETNATDVPFADKSIRVHRPVKLLLPSTINRRTMKEEFIVVDLDPIDRIAGNKSLRYQKLALQNSKRLMHGSLACFTSSAKFQDLIVTIISHRDGEQLLNGYINVEIIKLYNSNNIFDRELLMVESEIFFEPYHHVYNVLRNLRVDNFPLKSYIVDTQPQQSNLPDYMARDRKPVFSHQGIEFNLKQPSGWAPELADAIGFNQSQFDAFRLALTHKFAIIQGPPGTGKTFVGLKIVQTLLANTDHQILLICLTNHTLDQFLCGLLRYTNSLVRMGSQSKHALLDSYNVKQLNEDMQNDKRLRTCYYNTKQEYLRLMEQFESLQKTEDDEAIMKCLNQLQQTSRRIHELNQLSSYEFVKNIRIIGMTTTFASRNHTLLQLLKTPIVIVEEAAEILESHIVASLTPATEHCILIGDHFQLRPNTSVYLLSQKYKLSISLFERMIRNNLNAICLTLQHRMRPEIANLLRPTIYHQLEDSANVTCLPPVRGLKRNLYFFTHSNPEDGSREEEKSKKNAFECRMVLGLCDYLLGQGYTAEDIVILTAYNGQMLHFVLERKNREKLHGIRIASVDNYQGEESKIVLLSLVRSNEQDAIGFLAFRNRICVALSRACEGLYIVGNMELLARCSPIWAAIRDTLETQQAIGSALELVCERHGSVTVIKQPEDFERVNYGGCSEMCGVVADC